MKLKTITFDKAPKIIGVRAGDLGEINCENPTAQLRGWRVVIKGAMLVLVSPKGWKNGKQPREWDPQGPVSIWEMPRAACYLQWEGDDANPEAVAAALTKGYVSEGFGKPIEPSELEVPKERQPLSPADVGDA